MFEESSQPTQPATQQVLDPRRLGRNNSGLNDGDIADVLVILHPATPTAIRIVNIAAEMRPQHVLFRNTMDSMGGSQTDIEEQETIIINASGERVGQGSRAGADLALRMSSAQSLRFKELGFIFGRNVNSADIVFGQDSGKRISNQHFRIYLSADGILMIEDMSTNGTIVDDVLLKCKDKRFSKIRMLGSGSIICIQNANDDEMIKFVVRVPSRVTYMDRFRENLRNFIAECSPGDDKNAAVQRVSKQYIGPSMKWDGGTKYNILGILGKGAFATVHQLATKMEGRLLAAKELEKRRFMKNGMLDKKIDNEMKIMQGLRHANIVQFVEYHDQGDYLYIVMEFVPHGDLQGYLTQGGPMKESVVRAIAQQILSALVYLHRANITHRDIKPDNILIADVDPFTVKLSDFGLSKVVKTEETFLKTFCGTLLYCAPEVFPDFGHNKPGSKRRRGAKQYNAYSSSVDIWSFAGVLWYALTGEPPFKGIADATGEAMYNNIMATPLDPTPLRTLGVSEPCIDLLTRMLRTDPAERPSDRDCLNHPWLKEGIVLPTDPTLQSIVEEDESEDAEQQLSQLRLGAEIPESDEEDDFFEDEEMMAMVAPKRIRPDLLYPRNQIRDQDSSANPSIRSEQPVAEGESFRVVSAPERPRLFGEIGQSALQSSGILGAHINGALSSEGVTDPASREAFPRTGQAIGGAAENNASRVVSQLDGGFSSPSLLGAESMVRDLNMESPHSPVSRTQSPAMPATPRTPEVFQQSSLDQSSKQPSQLSEPTPKARPAGPDRQISLPLTASYYYNPTDPSTHNLEYASRVSGFDFVGAKKDAEAGASAYEDTRRASDTSGHSEYSTTAGAAPSPAAAVPTVPSGLDFKLPPKRLGKLTATPDSFAPGLTLNIDQSKTSWGRMANNTLVYEHSRDTRIPKTAFVIFFYSSAGSETVEELSQEGKDWASLPGLNVGIFTAATHGITINGKHLKKTDEKGRAIFGHLHTGDIVQVYQHPRGTECLKFKCEHITPCYCTSEKVSIQLPNTRDTSDQFTMRNFWALPAVLRIALASQHAFSVFDDLLAFPQYEVTWPDTFITENDATSLLSQHASPRSSSAMPGSQETQELSKRDKPTQPPAGEDALEHTYEAVVLQGQRYLCSIPIIPEEVPQNSTTTAEEAKEEEEKELVRATDRGWELLEGMKGSCIYYLSGWWSYSFCYKNEVKQFHQLPPSRGVPIYPPMEDTSVHSFVLGRYPKEESDKKVERKTLGSEQGSKETLDDEGNVKDDSEKGLEKPRLESKGSSRYMVQRLSGGTECDLTGRPRRIDVQFHCNPQSADRIAMIKETSTCSYLMIVDTPRLCHDVAFLPPQENLAHPITCQPVIPESHIQDWTAARIEAKLKEAKRLIAEHDDANLNPLREVTEGLEGSSKRGIIVGGIEVGAKALVGSEGKVIEKSVVVGGGKETYVGTVASSDGKQMTKEEMKKLNIADPKDVEKVKNNLKKLAGRKGWKLDLVDTPRGREFRGIIEAEDQDAPKKDEKKEETKGGMGNNKEQPPKKVEEAEEEEVQGGSEEVYKDEL
ncbi:Pkinase-domain-containing protein [Setomelanomma holmii]|uniref:Endoplasmic reticulum lectin n=1 Tax=Setomelanomma holmii TaxID=210430 RepID=A0A9P4LJX6_9PLEO|nr:Pkinase-domain-containing protein [Setomelanomma holmii]